MNTGSNEIEKGPGRFFTGPFPLLKQSRSADTEIQQMAQLVFLSAQVVFGLIA